MIHGDADKGVLRIYFPNESGESITYPLPDGTTAKCISEFHGEYDLDWVCEFDSTGNETRRWRAGYLAGIEWSKP